MTGVKPRRIVILAFPGVQPLDVVGPAEVFSVAGRFSENAYKVEVVAPTESPLPAYSGAYAITPTKPTAACRGALDTLIIAGGRGVHAAAKDERLIAWLRERAAHSRRVASVCTGAFLLGAAGLLDGRRATTHWASCELLAQRHPGAAVDAKPIYIRDEEIWTSAGVTAGLDLALALVEDDLGPEVSREVARWLVVFLQRPGGQSQFSTHLSTPAAARPSLRGLQRWMAGNLQADLRVPALADRVSMSPRHFARAFRHETGVTPGAYVEAIRLEAARQRLEQGTDPIDVVANAVGFGTPETMRRAFLREIGVPPAAYRARFAAKPLAASAA